MGTSGSYGGSTKKVWQDARQGVLDLPSDGGGGSDASTDKPLQDLWGTIADALGSDDPTLGVAAIDAAKLGLPALMPWLGSSRGGGGGGAGGSGGARTGGGRQGAGSRRQVTRGAARGGTVLGAAYAVRQGDSAYLQELGLDLAQLRDLSPVLQCNEILNAILGEGAHPDETALRKASLEAMKEVLLRPEAPDEATSLRAFVVNFVFELSLVELQRQVNAGALPPADVAAKERTIRRYLEKRVATMPIPGGSIVRPRDLRVKAAELTKEVVKVLRARTGGTA